MPLSRIANLMRFLRDRFPEGVNESGLTFAGFQSLHIDFMNILFREIPWTMLRKFGYNDDIKLADHLIPDLKRDPDQVHLLLQIVYCALYLHLHIRPF
jgi:mitochondrial Rho GTPase 1